MYKNTFNYHNDPTERVACYRRKSSDTERLNNLPKVIQGFGEPGFELGLAPEFTLSLTSYIFQ